MSMRRRQYRPPPATLSGGRYVLIDTLGTGGMATVFRVRDEHAGEERALKLLNEAGAERTKTRSRFHKEARTMSQLDHPHIIRIFDIGEEDGHFYFVMELAEGGSLAARLRQNGSLTVLEALEHVFGCLSGLEHAHTAGVVHRDVKPQNILLDAQGRVKLSDFGIARLLSDAHSMRITGTGDMLGTVAYMAPEQRMDPRGAGPRADLFSIGAMLYLMVTGRRPTELALAKIDPSVFESLPAPLRPIVRRATAHRVEGRYESARQMAEDVALAMKYTDPSRTVAALMDAFDGEEQTLIDVASPPASE